MPSLPRSTYKRHPRASLTDAVINVHTLSVPDHVTKLEKDMKKEFNAAARKAEAAEKAVSAPPQAKKRTHEEATTDTKITLTGGGVSVTVDQQTASSITSAVAGTSDPATKKSKVAKENAASAKTRQIKNDAAANNHKKSAQDNDTTKTKPSSTTPKSTKKNDLTKMQAKSTGLKPLERPAQAKSKTAPKPKGPSLFVYKNASFDSLSSSTILNGTPLP